MAPEGQLDKQAIEMIQKWDDPATAMQILETLDMCVRYSWASTFAVTVLETYLTVVIENEGTTYQAVVAQATWRTASEG